MRKSSLAYGASVALAVSVWTSGGLLAQDTTTAKPAMTGHTMPDTGKPAVEKSMPSSAGAATTKNTTGATNQSKTVKQMNNKAKAEVESSGK